MICLDVANGYSEGFVKAVQRTRASFPTHTIFAGNVVTPEMTEQLILCGADVIKVGRRVDIGGSGWEYLGEGSEWLGSGKVGEVCW